MKNKLQPHSLVALALIAAFVLAGCGGGGDGGGGSPPTPTPPPTPTQPATPTPPPVQAAALITAAPSAYTVGTEAANVYAAMNSFRSAQGLGPILQSTNIDLAAKNHQSYVFTHQSGGDAHKEIAGQSGFTGVDAIDRLVAAGYAATVGGEVIAFNTTFPITNSNVVEILADSVYHRSGMIAQGMTHMGFAPQDDNSPSYINLGQITPQKNAGNYVGTYPVDGQTGLSLTHYVESPNPFYLEMPMTSDNMCKFTSYPINVASEASTVLRVTSFTVTENGQTTPLDVRLITKATSAQDNLYLGSNVAFIVGKAPFKKNTKYNVHFVGTATGSATGTANGMAIDKSWSFTTGTDLRHCQ